MKLFNEKAGFGIEFETNKYTHRIGILKFKYMRIFYYLDRSLTFNGTMEIKFLFWAYANQLKNF